MKTPRERAQELVDVGMPINFRGTAIAILTETDAEWLAQVDGAKAQALWWKDVYEQIVQERSAMLDVARKERFDECLRAHENECLFRQDAARREGWEAGVRAARDATFRCTESEAERLLKLLLAQGPPKAG